MYYVYALYNKRAGKIYIGQTEDLKTRIQLHNSHLFKKSYTARIEGEWQLIYSEEADTREAALKRERGLKSYRGRQFIKLHIPQ